MFNTWPGLAVKDSLVGTENRAIDIMVFDHGGSTSAVDTRNALYVG